MKITIDVPDRYIDILSRFASVGRTFDNTEHCINELLCMQVNPSLMDKAFIARDELEILHKPLEDLHISVRNEIWRIQQESQK